MSFRHAISRISSLIHSCYIECDVESPLQATIDPHFIFFLHHHGTSDVSLIQFSFFIVKKFPLSFFLITMWRKLTRWEIFHSFHNHFSSETETESEMKNENIEKSLQFYCSRSIFHDIENIFSQRDFSLFFH